jgi:phosphoenolpyruvate carboxykinase (GTP)
MPRLDDLDANGLRVSRDDLGELLHVDVSAWKAELLDLEQHLARAGDRLPERMKRQLTELRARLG